MEYSVPILNFKFPTNFVNKNLEVIFKNFKILKFFWTEYSVPKLFFKNKNIKKYYIPKSILISKNENFWEGIWNRILK